MIFFSNIRFFENKWWSDQLISCIDTCINFGHIDVCHSPVYEYINSHAYQVLRVNELIISFERRKLVSSYRLPSTDLEKYKVDIISIHVFKSILAPNLSHRFSLLVLVICQSQQLKNLVLHRHKCYTYMGCTKVYTTPKSIITFV